MNGILLSNPNKIFQDILTIIPGIFRHLPQKSRMLSRVCSLVKESRHMFEVSAQRALSTASKPTSLWRLSFSKCNILKRAPLSNLLSRSASKLLAHAVRRELSTCSAPVAYQLSSSLYSGQRALSQQPPNFTCCLLSHPAL